MSYDEIKDLMEQYTLLNNTEKALEDLNHIIFTLAHEYLDRKDEDE